jgi:RND family efflux transporter MFP subunit
MANEPKESPPNHAETKKAPAKTVKLPEDQEPEHRGRGFRMVIIESAIALAAVVIVLLGLAGVFHRKVDTSPVAASAPRAAESGAVPVAATMYSMPRYEWAVGTVQAVNETALGSKLLAKVEQVNVKAGEKVVKGQVLFKLDDRDLQARVAQARSAIDGAQAQLNQAQVDYDRIMRLSKQNAVTEHEISSATNQLQAATAQVQQSRQALQESETILSYATIQAPFDGLVVDKRVEVGDTVSPGQIVVKLYDPSRMQFVATVRESLAQNLKIGQSLPTYIEAINKLCLGTVSEIVPQADVASRSFDVKLVGPCPPGMYTGIFGRMFIPLGKEEVLLIPKAAISKVGQLDLVDVQIENRVQRRTVQTGRTFGEYVEVLSGLQPGEKVLVSSGQVPTVEPEVLPLQLLRDIPSTAPAANDGL